MDNSENTIYLVASGDLRISANQVCWPTQAEFEKKLSELFTEKGFKVIRAHQYDPIEKHGFISTQRMGMDVFQKIPSNSKVLVAVSVWQYSYHLLAGLRDHKGPILTIANWAGQYPGLVGLLNLNASLTKMGVEYSTIWSENLDDDYFLNGIEEWIKFNHITHDSSHVQEFDPTFVDPTLSELGKNLSKQLKDRKSIIGVFDEGCMGMYNAIIEDELLNKCGIYKERLSQSALLAEMKRVKDEEANNCRLWLDEKGFKFETGTDESNELTNSQIHEQMKMYIAAMRMADFFGCDAIGIQYQQGLKDMAPASDLPEGLFNNVDRPPVFHAINGEELYQGQALPHFNEADEGVAVDALITNRVWTALDLDPATTLHDLRWGKNLKVGDSEEFVWVLEISGAVPASHIVDGYKGAISKRQPPMFFPLGGGTLTGLSKPGEIVWSRVYIEDSILHVDLGRGSVVNISEEDLKFLWESTNSEWPIMCAVLHGVSRNQMMAKHKANHIQVVYAPDTETADKALSVKAAMFNELGIQVHLCGKVQIK